MIWTYDVNENFKPLKKIGKGLKIHSTVSHIDFSQDSSVLMSNDLSYEILFWDVRTGNQITSAP